MTHMKRRLRQTKRFTRALVASQGQTLVSRLHTESSCVYLLSSLTGSKVKKTMLGDARSPSGKRGTSPVSPEFMEEKRKLTSSPDSQW